MRRNLLCVLLVVSLGAGCAKEDAPLQEQTITPGILQGVVTDVAMLPLANANVAIDGTNLTTSTDTNGAFQFEVLPGEYVVIATREEYRNGALRASVSSAQTSTLAFQLHAIPKIVPRVEVQEADGYLACAALIERSGEQTALPCGNEDPNERPTVAFSLATLDGLEAIVLEIVWEARTDAAKTLRVDIDAMSDGEPVSLGSTEGRSPLTVTIAGRLLSGDTLTATVGPAGGFTDDEAGSDAGLAFQQPFTGYASLFYHAPPPGGYSATAAI